MTLKDSQTVKIIDHARVLEITTSPDKLPLLDHLPDVRDTLNTPKHKKQT